MNNKEYIAEPCRKSRLYADRHSADGTYNRGDDERRL